MDIDRNNFSFLISKINLTIFYRALKLILLFICISGKYLYNRLYLENKQEIDSKILERLLDELLKERKEEEAAR